MKKELIFEGNEKRVYATENPDQVIFHFKDVMVAYNNVKRARLTGKGVVTNKISAFLLGYLNDCGIPTHFIKRIDEREQLCRKIEIIPLEVVFHNRMAGTLAAKLGVEDGFKNGAHKAYLAVPASSAASYYTFDLFTGINDVTINPALEGATVYTLSGVRVNANHLPAGIYIVNGKKMVIK